MAGHVYQADLKGTWRVAIDRNDVGVGQEWFKRHLTDPIQLPGTLTDGGYGDPITAQTEWTSTLHDRFWYLRKDYREYTEPNGVKVPFWLQPQLKYTGVAWYQRPIRIPESWRGRRVVASFERAHWFTTVWLDGRQIGTNDSLGTPHVYDLGVLAPGTYTLSVRIDNRYLIPIRTDAHAITDSTQTNWHGLTGRLLLQATTPVWIEDARAYGDIERKSVRIDVQIGNATGTSGRGTLRVGATSMPVTWDPNGGTGRLEVMLGDQAQLWDEFNPVLHKLALKLTGDHADDERNLVVGLRQIRVQEAVFNLNGRRLFLRGTHEGCEFPLTGYPPTDVESWRKVFGVVKAYGLNHMRFHSYCPPEAAFVAADELGVYLQPECSNWGQYSAQDGRMKDYLFRETERIVKAYGNHPSFAFLASGNEPAGPWQPIITEWLAQWKQKDNRRVYAGQSGRGPTGPADNADYVVYAVRGERGWFGGDFRLSSRPATYAVVSHETGQWCAYPNFGDMPKYTGSLKPRNYEIFRDSLAGHGMLDQARDFMMASGRFQVACYKEEIEGLLRTVGMSGFQLLDLHDYPGQGTALVGPLNVFWESKGYVTAEEFRRFCNVTVPLARMTRSVFRQSDEFRIDVEIAHFGPAPITGATGIWKVSDGGGNVVASGAFPTADIPIGNGTKLGVVALDLTKLAAPQKYRLVVGLKDHRAVENDWEFWVYPTQVNTPVTTEVLITRSFDEAVTRLAQGGKVLFLPAYDQLSWDCPPVGRLPIFWNRLMGPGWQRSLGLHIQKDHPALAEFPTDACYDWQWQDVIVSSPRAMNLHAFPASLRPIIQPIDDWNRNYRLALAFECRVGPGRLLVCSADLESNLDQRPAARQLRYSLLQYVASAGFKPSVEVAPAQIRSFLFDNQIMRKLGATAAAGVGPAANVIDGNPNTAWATGGLGRGARAAGKHPYELTIGFAKPVDAHGLVLVNQQNQREHQGDIREFVIDTSDDGQQWRELMTGRLESTFEPQTVLFGRTVRVANLRLRALSGFGSDTACSLAELAVLGPDATPAGERGAGAPYRNVKTQTEEIQEP